ncbi:DUF1080 domain-containing protein [Chitinophaga sp. MM2321]|uniref:3-keto-disaccharide hydrolase n=1 Tax=Chitinophaga sp. MM2321 TaxID=3137178 RepID=UPI0032D574A4
MRYNVLLFLLAIGLMMGCNTAKKAGAAGSGDGWISLFDGKSLNGWKAGENASTFSVADGAIVVNGPRAHLFYEGDVGNHNFKNFEFQAQVMTMPGSNSGIYFHTEFQQVRFPDKGFEVQVNNSHKDWKRTGSLYDIKDIKEKYVDDNVWFTEYIRVEGKKVTIKINDKTVLEYTEPANATAPEGHPGRLISSGTFALQGHDPKSKVLFKDLKVKMLRD